MDSLKYVKTLCGFKKICGFKRIHRFYKIHKNLLKSELITPPKSMLKTSLSFEVRNQFENGSNSNKELH